ncbi:MAG: histidinol-phosphatase HisJ family protein [Lachnospiraceae bacterium]|nr:histidinol-phosphatase HisJ family protein [Lachnospiraceae bacterium]
MAIKADFHMHSNNSTDSKEPMENMISKAIELGLDTICFTEHHDIDFPKLPEREDEEAPFLLNTDSYLYELLGLRNKYADSINVLFGVEIGIQPHLRRELAVYAKSYDFDFIIASTHLVGGMDPYYPSFYEGRSDEEAYREYFKEVLEDLKVFNNFDVFGHLDYVVRYGASKDTDYSYEKYKDCIDPIIEKILELEKGIELNTGAIRHGLRELNPCMDILKRYRELGGEIVTIGSDAHNTEYIASGFDRAEQVLLDCGFKYYATFEKRIAEYHRLG